MLRQARPHGIIHVEHSRWSPISYHCRAYRIGRANTHPKISSGRSLYIAAKNVNRRSCDKGTMASPVVRFDKWACRMGFPTRQDSRYRLLATWTRSEMQ
ncbi:hypothetical protein COCCADRAFT_102808 [Bipolaris zeicola 26-R-13]|uniref:Uncharacterized protein n=1 Tax=Cochliobolus carbonum (strain 26-R-13) TaxID=930089 RepID=W6XYN8_COCC2|nr:uncharacterized protein COCCADRAFT_102808 [Bipolaris zeicola 26-R-13]EUC30848.1 hypothetical protein COCCADRAFT_102808 [Bipolaris zeicola 26-R-13]